VKGGDVKTKSGLAAVSHNVWEKDSSHNQIARQAIGEVWYKFLQGVADLEGFDRKDGDDVLES